MTRRLSALALAVAVAAAAGTLTACGSSGSGSANASNGEVTLKVGAIPIVNVAPLILGERKGFFAAEKLKIQPQFAQGGAAIIPAVVSGSDQIGYGNITSIILAHSKGLPIRIVANSESSGSDPNKDANAVIVKKGSSIKKPGDLNGKRIAINTLQNINEMSVRAAADKLGADSSTFKFVEVPFPDMIPALDAGRVDAAAVAEPFYTQARSSGNYRPMFFNLSQTKPKLLIDAYFVTEQYYNEHKDVVQRFERAIRKSNEYAQAHPDEVRQIVTSYTKIPADEAKQIILPVWSGAPVDTSSLSLMSNLMVKYGLMKKAPPMTDLIKR